MAIYCPGSQRVAGGAAATATVAVAEADGVTVLGFAVCFFVILLWLVGLLLWMMVVCEDEAVVAGCYYLLVLRCLS